MHRGAIGSVAALGEDDLVDGDGELYELTRAQETDLPVEAKLTYIDSVADYRQATVEAKRLTVASGRVSPAVAAICLSQDQAQSIVERWLYEAWASRERFGFALPPSRLGVEPSDMLDFADADGHEYTLRVTESTDGEGKRIEGLSIEPDVYTGLAAPVRGTRTVAPQVFGPSLAVFLDLPLLTGDEVPHAGYVAAYQSPWPGGVAFYRSASTSGFTQRALVTAPAVLGVTEWDFYSGSVSRWDRGNKVRVKMDTGELDSSDRLGTLGGANFIAIENQDGEWELLQFQTADLVSGKTYDLSLFLRGQAGTEGAMRDPVPAGARVVLIDDSLIQVDMRIGDVGIAHNWKYGPAVYDIGHGSFQDKSHTFNGVGLRPLSPVHIHLHRISGSNDLQIIWTRRGRIGGDAGWGPGDVPLGEDVEAYEVDIKSGSTVKRTVSVEQSPYLYSEADQIADFGAAQTALDVDVYQIGTGYGRGYPGSATAVIKTAGPAL